MRRALILPLLLAACVAAPEEKPYYWRLVSIDGVPFPANATLAIDGDKARAFGQAPCNAWSGEIVSTPFPAWAIRNVVATEMACDDLAAEAAFFAAMAAMTHSAVGIGHLELVDQKGREMKFVPVAP
ncbi:MAG: META domain-containing protein [Rhodobacteraceae bacterium]|uniref:META domain-containing protein n=1 Tax=Tabrizicola sp. SY72 TaxID=2741673 RepID=UPI001572F928|nr:META domain-containing protein [Tabrizicola sp. SY72]MBL9054998.1 META domain-containing protein [Paracoccaceae bacterium]NTT86764.1 META domain-containing protein [Tabrizicola sp. SY72]